MKNNIQDKKITDSDQGTQLSNIESQAFKSDILEFKLTLKNNTELSIPVSKDGYVNCTKLCKAGGKRIDNWKANKQSKELLEAYSKLPHIRNTEKVIPGIPGITFSRVIKGNTSLKNQGIYYPMDIAIQIAQWIDPYFAIQVSRWTRELLLFGSVTLGQEKSSQELENKFQPYNVNLPNLKRKNYRLCIDIILGFLNTSTISLRNNT